MYVGLIGNENKIYDKTSCFYYTAPLARERGTGETCAFYSCIIIFFIYINFLSFLHKVEPGNVTSFGILLLRDCSQHDSERNRGLLF